MLNIQVRVCKLFFYTFLLVKAFYSTTLRLYEMRCSIHALRAHISREFMHIHRRNLPYCNLENFYLRAPYLPLRFDQCGLGPQVYLIETNTANKKHAQK
jgi:hypothetical protein